MFFFKGNCIILRHYLSIDAKHITCSLKRQQNNCIWKCLFTLSIKVNIVDPDQTAPTGPTGPQCLSTRLQIFNRTTKNIHFVIFMNARLRGPINLLILHQIIIPTQCVYRFSSILISPLVKQNFFYTSIKTHAYEYLISVLISQCY